MHTYILHITVNMSKYTYVLKKTRYVSETRRGVAEEKHEEEIMQELAEQLKETPRPADTPMTAAKTPMDTATPNHVAAREGALVSCNLESRLPATPQKQANGHETQWEKSTSGWEDQGWGRGWSSHNWGDQSWGRSWSSMSWDKAWGCDPTKDWSLSRGWSANLEPYQHEGFGGDNVSEAQHVTAALQRAATTDVDQARPTTGQPPESAAPAATDAKTAEADEAKTEAPVKKEPAEATTAPAGSNPGSPQKLQGSNEDSQAWRKNKDGKWLTPHALYMRFYRSIRSSKCEPEIVKQRIEAEGSSSSLICKRMSYRTRNRHQLRQRQDAQPLPALPPMRRCLEQVRAGHSCEARVRCFLVPVPHAL